MVYLDVCKGLNHIGRLGEHEHRTLRFWDSANILAMYPEATVTVLHKRPGDAQAYPVAPGYVEIQDGIVLWTIQSGDLARVGKGQVELVFHNGNTIAKSIIFDTFIDRALDGAGDPPEPWESWIDEVTAAADRAEDAAELLENPGATAETLSAGSEAIVSYSDGTFHFGIPRGQQGGKGDPGDDYVITEEDYDEIAEAVVESQGLQRIVDDATDCANIAHKLVDGKDLDGNPDDQYSENNAEFFKNQAQQVLSSVTTEGATQIAAIQAKGEETLESIPDDYTELSEDVDSLKGAISGDQTEVTLSSENGYYIATNTGTLDLENPRSYYVNYRGKYALVPCVTGDVFFVTGKGANNHKPWATCNSSGTYIRSNAQNTVDNEKVTIAEGEAYFIYNGEDGSPARLLKGLNVIEEIEIELAGTVHFDKAQTLTDAQKSQARSNIGAVDGTAIEDIEDAIHLPETVAVLGSDGHYITTNTGSIDISSPYSYYSRYNGYYYFGSCEPGDVFRVTGTGANNHRPWATCDSTGTIKRTCLQNSVTDEVVVIQEGESYIAYNGELPYNTGLVKGVSAFEELQAEIDEINRNTANPYKNMKAVAFGTSLTYRDLGYRPYLANELGITIDNQGVGSSFWNTWQQDSSNILYNVQNYTGFTDKDLCIIEGCTNDFGGNRVLGTYKDTGNDTVCGCLYNMISHVYTTNPDIQIFVVLDHFGRVYGSSDSSPAKVNTEGKTQYDYYEECAKLCAFYGIPCIKTYEFCNVGPFGTEYLYDNIHLNALGGQQVAQAIAKAMLCYKPKIVT